MDCCREKERLDACRVLQDTWRPFCVRYMHCSASVLDRGRVGLLLSLLSMFFVRRKAGTQ